MTGEVINLRQMRKAKLRRESEQAAAQARAQHGRTKAERVAAQAEAERLKRYVEQSRLEPRQSSEDAGGSEKDAADL
ncbi:DUF4169 family protein [Sphingomonas sp. ASY06-1R]|uniref:DUF4169 family protein n=1 Tax=Sphingomonas sp. ASY06-1R TaxID=3445771 RepID=UPI003FA2B67A